MLWPDFPRDDPDETHFLFLDEVTILDSPSENWVTGTFTSTRQLYSRRRHGPLSVGHCSLPTVPIDRPDSAPKTVEMPGGGEEDVDVFADVDVADIDEYLGGPESPRPRPGRGTSEGRRTGGARGCRSRRY
jgi:hypothetical protein